jgi:hypothetical protein
MSSITLLQPSDGHTPVGSVPRQGSLDQAEVAEVSRRIPLALFFDGRLDLTRIEPVFSGCTRCEGGRAAARS